MQTNRLIELARRHQNDDTTWNARLCLQDAEKQRDAANDEAARRWAVKSLMYSIGVLHAEYPHLDAMELDLPALDLPAKPPELSSTPPTSPYARMFAELQPKHDPRLIEAYVRLKYSTLDHVSAANMRVEAKIAAACIDAVGVERANDLAETYGL